MARLQLVDERSSTIELPLSVVRDAAENLDGFAGETEDKLRQLYELTWRQETGAALNLIGRLLFQLQGARASWAEFVALRHVEASCPDGIAQPAHGEAA